MNASVIDHFSMDSEQIKTYEPCKNFPDVVFCDETD